VIGYAWRDLLRNPRRTLAAMTGVALGVGLFSGVLFFVDGSGATMTRRAIAPLILDMQRIITAEPTDLRLSERISGPDALGVGDRATIQITATNGAAAAANDVVVRDEPPRPLRYVPDTTTLDGTRQPDIDGDSPLSHGIAGLGMSIGRLDAGASVTISYAVEATEAVSAVGSVPMRASVSSREQQVPIQANAPSVLTLDELVSQVAAIPGVAAADGLGTVDLPPGSLAAKGTRVGDRIRVFAFDQRYLDHYPSIRLVSGRLASSGALLSVEAARSLGVERGSGIELTVAGRAEPLRLPVTGTVDLAQAQPLFSSRKASKLEEFLYVPDSVVVSPTMFRDVIVPAFERARATVGTVTKSFPVLEADVLLDRPPLEADPATALAQTTAVTAAIDRIGPGQGYVIDNISNALAVARVDAATGRRMFLFLGLPGAMLAAFLAAFAASILAATERREHAILRVRGADRRHLRTIALTKSLVIACVGSITGVVLGLLSAAIVLGADTVFAATNAELIRSAVLSATVGLVVTAIALYVPARRSIGREVSEQRRALREAPTPLWRRSGLDIALVAAAVALEIAAVRGGALDPPAGSVYAGIAISLPTNLLSIPVLAWVGGLLLCVRLLVAIASRAPMPTHHFGEVVLGVSTRTLRRRAIDLTGGILGLGLVVAFGTGLALFAATYDAAKDADARFILGSDIRITPSVLATSRPGADDASAFLVPGVAGVSPVVFDVENAVLIGRHNQQRENLAAVDPSTFSAVAPLPDQVFIEATAADTMAALAADPRGVLVDEEAADDLSVRIGDRVGVILALGTKREIQDRFRVAGLFERFPGMSEGANLVVNLDRYTAVTGIRPADFFLAKVDDDSIIGMARAIGSLASGPGQAAPIHIDSTDTTLAKDQSSLTAVNVNGLVLLNTFYALVMSATAIAIFVFGLLLHRRGEFVALRALGMASREVRALVIVEAAVVTLSGLAAGLLVGTVTAFLSIGVLRGLFVLDPRITLPVGRFTAIGLIVLVAAAVSSLVAAELLRRLDPAEILREE
jgi:putative ABC transport system permease protein